MKKSNNKQSRGYLINRKHEIKEKGKIKYCLTGWVSRKIAINTLFFFVIRNIVKYFADTELFSITNELKMLILILPILVIIMGYGGFLEWDLQMNLMKVSSKNQEKVIKRRFINLYGVVLWGLPILLVNTFSYNYLNNDQVVLIVQLAFDAFIFLSVSHYIGRFIYKNKQKEYLS
ncbi:MAG: hypothetical protein JEZ08_23645 [Clostridiales bacterium]|nr:hypothetical protein [Clostridiales bacterium]